MIELEKKALGAIFVHPEFMQRGIGMKLVEAPSRPEAVHRSWVSDSGR
ncbi:hypothetical protein OR16_12650 [Cupriavidus basilensis OR16]|uniref:Uncharacterized protein n=1 Tax=Cupriavidus basilensis OR16 TaxID=1127483 RepID=H1S448_9BURK|nr:hypothetical protein OR16_12650 [Cupriavidus basilensis OR16]